MESSAHTDTQSSFVLLEAWDYLAENRPADAVEMADAWLTHNPRNVEAKIILSQGLLRMGKLERLHQLLGDVDNEIKQLSLLYLRLGELCRQSGLHAEAEKFYKKYNALKKALSLADVPPEETTSREEYPDEDVEDVSPEFHTVTLADLYLSQGHFDRARTVLNDIISRDPGNKDAVKKLAEINKMMTLSDNAFGLPSTPAGNPDNALLIARLERWLSRLSSGTESRAIYDADRPC
jgi:predicted Zn-dependent protease